MGGNGSGRGTIPGKERNIKHLKWEIIFITPDGRMIHQKFKSAKQVQRHPDLEFLSSGKLDYYSNHRPTIGGKNRKRKIGHLQVYHIHELV